jgi:uncharacterized protein (TIGR02611 family)
VTDRREQAAPGEPEAGADAVSEAARDAEQDDWEWRRKIRANPAVYPVYRAAVIVLGIVVAVVGLALVPLPGPGWLIVFAGVAILGSEFEPAQRLLDWAKARLSDWSDWLKPKPLWVKGLVALATAALVAAFFYVLFLVSGVPGFIPDLAEDWIERLPGL